MSQRPASFVEAVGRVRRTKVSAIVIFTPKKSSDNVSNPLAVLRLQVLAARCRASGGLLADNAYQPNQCVLPCRKWFSE